jgi:superfamily II DNA or RNA helicase/HKD family nuclease
MSTKFFTNENENTLINKIEGIFKHRDIHFFDALVGYFRASGYFRIRRFVEKAAEIRILVGINIDKLIYKAHEQGLLFDGNFENAEEDFFLQIKKNIQDSEYDKEVEEGMLQLIDDIISKKVIIKVHPKQNIHAKIYIFREQEKHNHGYGAVITGSSNLTDAGLSQNFEFNVELRDNTDIEFASETFEKLWNESVEISDEYIDRLKKETFLNDAFTPYQVYLKFLIEYFGKSIEFDPNSISDLPKGFKRLSYQIDAVNDGYTKMTRHNGFFLADVVGLGKTIVATLIAKKYFYTNGFPSYRSRTLIIVPPALKDNWTETIDKFHLDNVEIITNGSLHKITNREKYDLIIVDEAHKFRSDTAEMYNDLQKITKATTKRILPDGSRVPKRVILISATPLNNRPEDIANQVYLFQDSKNSTLEVGNLQHFFRQQIDAYNKLKAESDLKIITEGVKKIYDLIRIKVIEPLTVRRTRTDLEIHDQYSNDLKEQGIRFPKVIRPEKVFYELEPKLEQLYDKTIHYLSHPTQGLTYNRYRAIAYLKPHKRNKYHKAENFATQLATIMKTLLVKRIDSSFYAFKQSLLRFTNATKAMVTMFDTGKIYIAPNLPVSEFINDGREEELLDLVLQKAHDDPTIEICEPNDFEESFVQGLNKDYEILKLLSAEWNKVEEDPKLDEFINCLNNKLFDKKKNPEQKLVVFSESKETTSYLEEKLKSAIHHRIVTIDSKTRKEKFPIVRANFDANISPTEQQNDYDIIISTEVLAEGVNLHRANIIVNYDTPWNSTRLMQRIGRVNRIGSRANEVHILNFFPTAQVNNDIELEKKAIMKLQAFHAALGEDSQIYSQEEVTQSFGMFDKDPDNERDEKLDYLMEIRKIKESNPELFKAIKNMPLRARVGRKSKILKHGTICFIRDARRDAFLYVKNESDIEELTFLETVKEFQAKAEEQSIKLHDLHHEQVKKGVEHFANKQEEEKARDRKIDIKQGPNETKALSYLDAFLNLPFSNEADKELILLAKEAIRKGKFQNLQRDINKLQKAVKKTPLKPVLLLEKVIAILKNYPLQKDVEEPATEVVVKQINIFNPEIIISESFS